MINGNYAVIIVGFGGMGGWHFENISEIEGAEVIGVFDIDEKRGRAAERRGLKAYASLEDALGEKSCDIILIATPNDSHKDIAVAALKAGKHVLCEKPVAMNSTELEIMQNTAREYGRVFTIHQNRRFDEDFLTAKKVIESGKLGDTIAIESRVHGSRGIPGDWRGKKRHGGGMVLDWGVHILDQIMLFYDVKIKKVYGVLTNITNGEVDDGFRVILTLENGVTAYLEVGTSNFQNLPRWYIIGTNGTCLIEDFSCTGKSVVLKSWEDKDVIPVRTAAGLTKTMAPRGDYSVDELPLPEVKSDIKDFFRNLIAVIEGREEPIVKPHEARRLMRLMEAIFESAEKGEAIDFE